MPEDTIFPGLCRLLAFLAISPAIEVFQTLITSGEQPPVPCAQHVAEVRRIRDQPVFQEALEVLPWRRRDGH